MDLLDRFKTYLTTQAKPASKVTVKNYISDVFKFTSWLERRLSTTFEPQIVTPELIEEFKNSDQRATVSIERSMSSLRKFFNFLKLEDYISQSPFELKSASSEALTKEDFYHLKEFKNYLYVYNASALTIKNYLADVKNFLKWLEKVTTSPNDWETKERNFLLQINSNVIESYKQRLLQTSAPRTINRKLSSIRKYLTWAESEGMLPQAQNKIENLNLRATKLISKAMDKAVDLPHLPRKYSGFPPFRLAQKSFDLAKFIIDLATIAPVVLLAKKTEELLWRLKGKPVFEAVKRQNEKVRNLPKDFFAPLSISTNALPVYKKILFHARYTRPKWYQAYHNISFTHYLHLAILFLAVSLIGFNLYINYIHKPTGSNVLGVTNPKAPPRILSFQGRLTDASDSPITTATDLRFGIYDSLTGTGSALKWQEVNTVTPDSDGVFNVLLGNKSTMQQNLFAEHAGLWLGITVGKTPELTPRQRLATVAYAENAELLQGLPPITDPGAGTNNVVLALDSSGNLTIGGTATPKFQATGGKFTVSGNVLSLTTLAGSNSNVEINPDGRSFIDLQKPLQNTSNNNNISTALGAVEVNDLFAILATSSGQSAFTINQNDTGPIISASASGVQRFTVDNSGNTTISGNFLPTLTASKDLGASNLRWNNIWVQTINATGTNTSGQASFTYDPLDTTYAQGTVLINPTAAGSNELLLAAGIGGIERASIDAEGDLILGFTGGTVTRNSNPLTIYNHGTTQVASIDTSGNLILSGDLALNGGDLTSTATTFNLLNSTVTTLNFGGAATTLSIGASTGTTTVNNALTVTGATNLNAATTITAPSSSTIPLTVKAATSQSVDLLQLKTSLDAVIAKVDQLGNITGNTLISTVATGTAPLTVTSTTMVANLNAASAQQPNPNLVLNSDFSRRNKWMTFMPEVFSDTAGWTAVTGTLGTVSSNILTAGTAGNWQVKAGLSTWRDVRVSAQFKLIDTTSGRKWGVRRYIDANNYVEAFLETTPTARLHCRTVTAGVGDDRSGTGAPTITLNNWYWIELEIQGGSMAICKIYTTGSTSPVAKSSGTLAETVTNVATQYSSGAWGEVHLFTDGGALSAGSQWGGLATGDGGVYVEGWGPEGWTVQHFNTKGGQAIGFDETADSGPIEKQWAVRAYIPAASRSIDLYQRTPSGGVQASTNYTHSIYMKVSGKGGTGDLIRVMTQRESTANANQGRSTLSDAGETSWTRKSGTFTTESGTRQALTDILINSSEDGAALSATGTAYILLPQLEQGSTVTPWRNAPADDGPIVWKVTPASTESTTTSTTSTSFVEANPRDLAGNFFLPWDGSVDVDFQGMWRNDTNNGNNVAGFSVDGTDAEGTNALAAGDWVTATVNTNQSFSARTAQSVAAGKHRIAARIAIINTGTLTLQVNSPAGNFNRRPRLIVTATRGKFDLAEEYSVEDQSIEGGDVVKIKYGSTVEKTTKAYDPSAFGIISTDPGITLSSQVELNEYREKPNLRPLALQGRVPVKATTENGPIYRGDVLTSSSTKPGYAMKATKAGKAIGIAMEDLYDGEGKIMTFVNLSWYDPDVYLTDTGELKIDKVYASNPEQCEQTTEASNFGAISVCPNNDFVSIASYKLTNSIGETVDRVGIFGNAFAGVIKAGLVETKDLVAENIIVDNKIVSPIGEIQVTKTDTITSLSSDKIVIKLEDNSASPSATSEPRLEIQNASGSAVAIIDDEGNASFSGTLSSFGLIAESASVSGTLQAKNIVADNIESAIYSLRSSISSLSSLSASSSAVDIATYSAQLANVDTLQAEVGSFSGGLFAIGPTSLSDATVFGQLSVGANLILADNSINVLGENLKIQPLGQGGVDFLAGKFVIDSLGNLTIEGNTTVKGTLFANVLSPLPGSNVLEFKNATGSAIAAIDDEGNATFRKLNLSLVEEAFALSEKEILATGSAGIATISAEQNELTINNKLVTQRSLIYITPVGTSSAQTPYLLRQEPGKSFTVGGAENSIFNWLIIN